MPQVLLFDGVCTLCNRSVDFVHRREPRGDVLVASLQSRIGQALLLEAGLPDDHLAGIVLVDGDELFEKSGAALRVARRLRFPWPLLSLLLVVPAPVRDAAYDWVARNRARWFGTQPCRVPDEAFRARFFEPDLAAEGLVPGGPRRVDGPLLERARRRARELPGA